MIYVQHLLGIGHLQRASLLCNALHRNKFEVNLITGGIPVSGPSCAGVKVHQLPPVRSLDDLYGLYGCNFVNWHFAQVWKYVQL